MTNDSVGQRLLQVGALLLIGNGVMGLLRPRWHTLPWRAGPQLALAMTEELADNPKSRVRSISRRRRSVSPSLRVVVTVATTSSCSAFFQARVNFEIVPAATVPLEEQARLANEAFAGYVGGWAEMDTIAFARFLLAQGADLFYSRLVAIDGELAGFGYITRTANFVRLAGMALIPSARGTGAAAELLLHLFEDAKANRDEAMILEVIEQNPRAIAFYRRHGFRELTAAGRMAAQRLTRCAMMTRVAAATDAGARGVELTVP